MGTPGTVTIVNFSVDGKNLGRETVAKVVKTDGEWMRQLGKNSFEITRQADTETPYFGVSWNEHRHGLFRCIGCDLGLFSSTTKFDSGTGWPSFWAPLAKENVAEISDASLGMERNRGAMRTVRRAPGACLQRWTRADRSAVLHELGVDAVCKGVG